MKDRLEAWAETANLWCMAGLLVAVPLWRHRVLVRRPGDPVFFEFHDITLYTTDLLWWGTLGTWLLSCTLSKCFGRHPFSPRDGTEGRIYLGPWFLFGPLLGFLALSAVGIPWAVDPLYAVYRTLKLVLLMGLYLAVLNMRLTPGSISWPLAVGIVLQAGFALPQFTLGRSLGMTSLGEITIQAAWPGASVVMVGNQRWLRAYGLTQHPNLLGGVLMSALLLIGGYYLMGMQTRSRALHRALLLLVTGLGLVALLLTFSRAAWLGSAVGGLAFAGLVTWARRKGYWSPQRPAVASLVVLILVVLIGFAAIQWPLLQPRLGLTSQGVEIRSVGARLMQMEAAWALIQMRPVLGVGLGNFPTALYWLARETVAEYPVYQPVHNVLLLATAELGALGGLLWLFLIVAPWVALSRARILDRQRHREVRMGPWWAGVSAALAALTVVSFLDSYVWSSQQGQLLFWLVLALWAREWTVNERRLQVE